VISTNRSAAKRNGIIFVERITLTNGSTVVNVWRITIFTSIDDVVATDWSTSERGRIVLEAEGRVAEAVTCAIINIGRIAVFCDIDHHITTICNTIISGRTDEKTVSRLTEAIVTSSSETETVIFIVAPTVNGIAECSTQSTFINVGASNS